MEHGDDRPRSETPGFSKVEAIRAKAGARSEGCASAANGDRWNSRSGFSVPHLAGDNSLGQSRGRIASLDYAAFSQQVDDSEASHLPFLAQF